MDLIQTGHSESPPASVSLQEKAFNLIAERTRSELALQKQVTRFMMWLVGSAFLVLTVALIPAFLGVPLPLYLLSPFAAVVTAGGSFLWRKVIAPLFSGKQ